VAAYLVEGKTELDVLDTLLTDGDPGRDLRPLHLRPCTRT
jgi:hypothetical protein